MVRTARSRLARVVATARVLEFDVILDRDRTARSGRGGSAIPADDAWSSEHLVLAGLVRCTLASLDYRARKAGLEIAASGSAHAVITKRDSDGLYAFVAIESHFELVLDRATEPRVMRDLVTQAEKGCFVGNSLVVRPSYHWTINGEEVS
jgi:organic hydroperoxide reductase OsmC/OhrA